MSIQSSLQRDTTPSLTSCDREPIHLLGNVQSFGCLISVSTDWLINHVSTNTKDILGIDPDSMIGTRFSDHFTEQTAHKLRGKTQILTPQTPTTRCFAFDLFEDGRLFDIAVQTTPRGYAFEFEVKPDGPLRDDMSLVQSLIARVRAQDDLPGMTNEGVRALAKLTGFDRVMVYQFAADGSGSVVAEARDTSTTPYLGLRFPASDIPKQARELYRLNPIRLIADVDAEVHPVIPRKNPEGETLDLSLAVTRAVSPIHLQYLRNMGLRASMSLSILRRGELWGLVACHHFTPRYVSYETRTAVELFVQLFSYELSDLLNEEEHTATQEAHMLHNRVMTRLSSGTNLHQDFEALAEQISDAIAFDGIALYSEGEYRALGLAPSEAEFLPMVRFLNTMSVGDVFSTECLVDSYPQASAFLDRAAGVLVLPISRQPRDYIVLFRRELTQVVKWAGEPAKTITDTGTEQQLSPRSSFAAWKEVVKGRCSPWLPSELSMAQALRATLVEVVLKVSDYASKERAQAQQKQELLIAELNHRVRNILNLITGLVGQSNQSVSSVSDFSAVLDGRIKALARAHDQLTTQHWSPVSVKTLLQVELSAYTKEHGEQAVAQGDDFLLQPEAVSTVVLVLHELVTNAAKHGALSQPEGKVSITLSQDGAGTRTIEWRELGGPPVQAPTTKGFGSTIIESSIPFELKGRVETRYRMPGLEVDIHLPERYCRPIGPAVEEIASPAPISTTRRKILGGDVLLVEDALIIAMHTSDMLSDLGAERVHIASSVREAMTILDTHPIRFAVLDVNLGDETSLMVAQRLSAAGLPYILATGYGSAGDVLGAYPTSPILKKPFQLDTLEECFRILMKDADGNPKP